jgi:predicted nucleic acid-binding protein
MIAADTSALISLASIDLLNTFLTEFDVHTTDQVVEELEDTAEYENRHGDAVQTVLDNLDRITTHQLQREFTSSRVDQGEGSCALLTKEIDTEFLITNNLRALPELQTVADATVAISPIVLKALVQRDTLEQEAALEKLDELAEQRDWLGAPIYTKSSASSPPHRGRG